MNQAAHDQAAATISEAAPAKRRKGIDWSDPRVAIGNAPPLPRWPLVLMILVWLAWIGFLLVTSLTRIPR